MGRQNPIIINIHGDSNHVTLCCHEKECKKDGKKSNRKSTICRIIRFIKYASVILSFIISMWGGG